MQQVAVKSIAQLNLQPYSISKRPVDTITQHPPAYLNCCSYFKRCCKSSDTAALDNSSRYDNGLKKLKETEVLVEGLKVELIEMQPVLKQAQIDTDELMKKVAIDQAEADKVKAGAEKESKAAAIEVAKEVEAIKEDCERLERGHASILFSS